MAARGPGPVTAHRTGHAPAPGRPRDEDLQGSRDLLDDGEKIAILAGAGCPHAREELLAVAEKLGAPIVKTLSGQGLRARRLAVHDRGDRAARHPADRGTDGGDRHAVLVGTNFPYTKHLPAPGKVRVAQIEADPVRAGGRIATEVPVVGDAKEGLQALLPMLKQRSDTSFLEKYQKPMATLARADGRPAGSRAGTRSPRSTWWACSTNWPPTTPC